MKAPERREQVLACAAELFAEQGYHPTTVEHIVLKAGIARGTFYLYFQDKRSIFAELLARYIQDILDHITPIDTALGRERCLELMRGNVEGVLGVCLRRRHLTRILLAHAVGLDEDFDRQLNDFYREITDLLERTLAQAQDIELVPPVDVRIAAFTILGSLKEILYQVVTRGLDMDETALVEELVVMYRSGLITI